MSIVPALKIMPGIENTFFWFFRTTPAILNPKPTRFVKIPPKIANPIIVNGAS
jgi:hypothetical protein